MSFSRGDLGLEPIYREMGRMKTERERRDYLRRLLFGTILSSVPAPASTLRRGPHRSEAASSDRNTGALPDLAVPAKFSHADPVVAPPLPPAPVLKSKKAVMGGAFDALGLNL